MTLGITRAITSASRPTASAPAFGPSTGTESTITDGGTNYLLTKFNSTGSGTFGLNVAATVEYLIVAGGGSAPASNPFSPNLAGGGGGGQVRSGSVALAPGNYAISVGVGGSGTVSGRGDSGGDSSFNGVTSQGGGGGGSGTDDPKVDGLSGGPGGGGGFVGDVGEATGIGGGGTFSGGDAFYDPFGFPADPAAGSGAGAGASGYSPGSGSDVADGGAGVTSGISGATVTYGGGGAGSGDESSGGASGSGGSGGGGSASAGVDGLGGGGGAGLPGSSAYDGGNGVILLRYPT